MPEESPVRIIEPEGGAVRKEYSNRLSVILCCAGFIMACEGDRPHSAPAILAASPGSGAVPDGNAVANGAERDGVGPLPTGNATGTATESGALGQDASVSAGDEGNTAIADRMGMVDASSSSRPAGSFFPNSVRRPQIMIVGDSISAGPGCYKKYLLSALTANGYSNFDFVGAYTDDCGGGVRHSARSCSTAEQYTEESFTLAPDSCNPAGTFPGLATLVADYHPDLLMIQLGVNDVWAGRSTESILGSYATLVDQARAQNPNIVIAVAQIQQIRPSGPDGDVVFARAQQLVSAVPAWVETQNRPESPVLAADLWSNSDAAETLDGVHPDDAGAQRMGLNWFAALSEILSQ